MLATGLNCVLHNVQKARLVPVKAMADAGQVAAPRYAIAIHGGAGVINETNKVWLADAAAGLREALHAGQQILEAGGSALDAVEAAVVVMEDDPHFNAGRGSVLTRSGCHELEASVMTCDGRCGAATLLKRSRYPIRLARAVMERSPHILLAGEAAEELAAAAGQPLVGDNAWFTTPQRREQWERYKEQEALAPHDEIVQKLQASRVGAEAGSSSSSGGGQGASEQHQVAGQQGGSGGQVDPEVSQHTQTVGAVAVDSQGRLAAATSTGGRTNKWDGRIGDTPIIGAGNWADRNCALSGTGVGEEFLRRAACHDVAARMAYKGLTLQAALDEVVFGSFGPGDGGFVGVDSEYNIAMSFNSPGMYRGAADSTGRFETAIFQEQQQ